MEEIIMQGIPLEMVERVTWSIDYGLRLQRKREELGMSREDVARQIKALDEPCSQQLIYKIENWQKTDSAKSDRSVSFSLIRKYCQVLGVSIKHIYPIVEQSVSLPLFEIISSKSVDIFT